MLEDMSGFKQEIKAALKRYKRDLKKKKLSAGKR